MTHDASRQPFADLTEAKLRRLFDRQEYVADTDIVIPVLLALRLGKPLLVEGEPGSGKTELGSVLAAGFDTELIRLQCYEGLAAESTLYEWNYTKQLLSIQAADGTVTDGESVFEEAYLLERPLLRALSADHERPPVLLIDELDRADEEFEALLLEFLAEFQVTIPELGTVETTVPPVVIITSNRTRGLSDALKRRCLYLHVEQPSFETEYEIVRRHVPELADTTAAAVCGAVERLREEPLLKRPGVAETLDWARALDALEWTHAGETPAAERIDATLACLLKEAEDVERVDEELLEALEEAAVAARDRLSNDSDDRASDATPLRGERMRGETEGTE